MFDTASPDRVFWPDPPADVDERERRRRVRDAGRAVGTQAGHINAAFARQLEHLGEFLRLGGWHDEGARTPQEWVGWRLGVTPGDARHIARMALTLDELPKIRAAFRAGELSFWQVRAIVPIATPPLEADLLNLARSSTAAQLARIARGFRRALDADELDAANARHKGRRVAYHFDEDGFFVLHGKLCPEDGAVLISALERVVKDLAVELPDEEVKGMTYEQRRADALVEMARRASSYEGPEASAGSATKTRDLPPETVVHVDLASLIAGDGDTCEIEDGPTLPSETARRLSCDGALQALYTDGDKVLDMGRRQRTPSPRLRRALEHRDKRCRFPGCDRKGFLQAHHLVHWGHLGPTAPHNLLLLCFHHHRLVHEGGWRIEGDPNGDVTFVAPHGRKIAPLSELGNGDPTALEDQHAREHLVIDPDTCTTLWDGSSVNVVDCVHGLLFDGGFLAPRRPRRLTGINPQGP